MAQVASASLVVHSLPGSYMPWQQVDGHPAVMIKSAPGSPGSSVIAKIPNGEVVAVLSEHMDYVLVRWKGVEGYARSCNLVMSVLRFSDGYATTSPPMSSDTT